MNVACKVWRSGSLQSSSVLTSLPAVMMPIGSVLSKGIGCAVLFSSAVYRPPNASDSGCCGGQHGGSCRTPSGVKSSSLQHNHLRSRQTTAKEQLMQIQNSTYVKPMNALLIATTHFVIATFSTALSCLLSVWK